MNKYLLIIAAATVSSIAGAQSMNIDMNWPNVGGTLPTASYAAAGSAGVWNNANVNTGVILNLGLVNLGGGATTALLNVTGFGPSLATSGPWTGNDQALMEDAAGSGSGGATILFSGLLVGNYNVFLYGQAASGNLTSSFTINNVTQTSGGAWGGSHILGNSYTKFTGVPVSTGNMTINYTGNCNGIQLQYSPVPEPMTVAAFGVGLALLRRRMKSRNRV